LFLVGHVISYFVLWHGLVYNYDIIFVGDRYVSLLLLVFISIYISLFAWLWFVVCGIFILCILLYTIHLPYFLEDGGIGG